MKTQKNLNLKKILLVILAMAVMLAVFLHIRVRTKPSLQTTDTVLMVSPVVFGFNEQTAGNNAFQKNSEEGDASVQGRKESDDYIALLRENGINVIAVEDTPEPHTPDSVFPNNWFSTHDDGTLGLYPMYAENRRLERKPAVHGGGDR